MGVKGEKNAGTVANLTGKSVEGERRRMMMTEELEQAKRRRAGFYNDREKSKEKEKSRTVAVRETQGIVGNMSSTESTPL